MDTRLPVFDVHLLPPPDPDPAARAAEEAEAARHARRTTAARWWLGAALGLYVIELVAVLVWVVGA